MTNRPTSIARRSLPRLTEAGDIPLNPAVLPDGLSQADYISICMSLLQRADANYMLNSWKGSGGAVAEYHLALKLGLKIMTQHSVTTYNKEVSTL